MALLTMLLIGAGLIFTNGAAGAATPGLNPSITLNGASYNGTDVVNEGDVLQLAVQYSDAVVPGSTADFEFSDNVTISDVPTDNQAIESIVQDGNTLSITFKDPWPAGVNQGVFVVELTVNEVENSSMDVISWKLDGEETTLEVIIRDGGDQFENVNPGFGKGVNAGNLSRFVEIDEATGVVSLDEAILEHDITYTLSIDTKDPKPGFELTDTLPTGFAYQPNSFTATITTWDEDGLNRETNPFPEFTPTIDGGSFSDTFDLPGPSQFRATYKVRVDGPAGIAELEALLQTAYDGRDGAPGNFSVNRTNTAHFDGEERTATVTISGTIRGVNIGNAFAKSRNGWETTNVDEDGTLAEPLEAEWNLRADLRQWTGENPNFVLSHNVVIEDTLPAQASWKVGDPEFISASGIAGVSELTNAGVCPETVADFQGDEHIGSYCVDGQTVMINVGKNNATNATITLLSELNTVDGLPNAGQGTTVGSTRYEFRNNAAFHYRAGEPLRRSANRFPVVLPESDGGYSDETVFSKSGHVKEAVVSPGDTVEVDYRFVVGAGKGIDVRTSHIVDELDRDVFDLDDPADANISGVYDGQALTADDFEVTFDDDDNLVIALSESGRAVVDDRGVDKTWIVDIHLVTKPFDGKETKEIRNRAVLFGQDEEPFYWSESESSSTSYGSEAEVAKRVFDRTTERWETEIREYMDGDGNLAERTQFYRIEFRPHGSYNNVVIVPVEDILPDAVDFIGFVEEDEDGVPDASDATQDTTGIGGNLEVSYDDATRTVTISQMEGTRLDASQAPITAIFAVEVTDASAPIVNVAGDSETIIEPVPSVWVGDYVWVDSNRDGLQDDGEPGIPEVTLILVGPDGGQVTDVFGNPVEPTVTDDDGWYTFQDLPVLEDDQTYTVLIDRDASEEALRPYVPTLDEVGGDRAVDSSTWEASTIPGELHEDGNNDPTLDFGFVTKSYAIGDYVWIDTNRDGIQDADEPVLPGVIVELLDEEGVVLDTTPTDAEGRYLFDGLDAGTYRVRFTLTEDQAKKFIFTEDLAGDDTAVDSDADPATGLSGLIVLDDDNPSLTGEYDREFDATQGIDPTWDAGVIRKSVSVGDFVWVDENRDGVQDEGEPGIPEVTLCLIGPDGEPVVDVYGNPVEPTVTDETGWYSFENLPSLDGDETYTVCIDREASEEALRPYVPTLEEVGDDRSVDSSTWEASTVPGDLQEDGDRDPTLDFGFVTKSYAIGDYVWIDKNRDGIQDADEPALPGVKVELFDEDGNLIDDTTTDAEGRYLFDGLPEGTYQIRFTLTDEQAKKYRFTSQNSGSDTAVDSDADPSTGYTVTIVLDDDNTSLTGEYDREFDATQGIDPTWDAGVVEIPDEETPPGGDVIDETDGKQEPGGSGPGILARTGSDVRTITILGMTLLALGGLGLGLRRRRRLA